MNTNIKVSDYVSKANKLIVNYFVSNDIKIDDCMNYGLKYLEAIK